MTTEKRNALAAQSCLYVPLAGNKLTAAAQAIRDQRPDDALEYITDAQGFLELLVPLFADACEEAKAES
jgi:hypothetical protein